MKQLLQNFRTGEITVEEIPAPQVRPGSLLVANRFSLISAGTEGATARLGQMSLLGKARARPEQVRKVLNVIKNDGLATAFDVVRRSLETPLALGYCSSGVILEAGPGVDDLTTGDAVACGGAGYANHAEIISVPRNLAAPLPEDVDARHAAFTTLGAIAMQSLRVADVRLGENVVVIGLGLIGCLVAQLLRAAGCRVCGIDVSPHQVEFANHAGLCHALLRGSDNLAEQVASFCEGRGADSVIITAPSSDNDPVRLAGELSRPKGRVVVVGRTVMEAPRETFLFKELELRTSLAYGPGTGDVTYEEQGLDYPYPYVRWTENRNMQAFLELVAAKKLLLEPLITHEFDIAEAAQAFDVVTGKTNEWCVGVLLSYPRDAAQTTPVRRVEIASPTAPTLANARVRVSVAGAGSFATNFLVPALVSTPGLSLRGIASASGVRAQALGAKYKFAFCASDAATLASDEETDCLVILTRHDSHAPLCLEALNAGKHVFVEKPLAMTVDELASIVAAQRQSGRVVQVGFNRRFSPLAVTMKEFFDPRAQPMSITYRANVGYRPPEHWLHDPQQGGGVILGEAVHFVDFCCWLIGANPVKVTTRSLAGERTGLIADDNVHITLNFAEGSLATIVYVSNGDPSFSRERVEAFADGGTAVFEDFRSLVRVRGGRTQRTRHRVRQQRGYAEQLRALAESIQSGTPAMPMQQAALSMLATLEAVESLRSGTTRSIDPAAIGL